jgi:hypothetical protein
MRLHQRILAGEAPQRRVVMRFLRTGLADNLKGNH